jgi:hypothetical protein
MALALTLVGHNSSTFSSSQVVVVEQVVEVEEVQVVCEPLPKKVKQNYLLTQA